jgi:membrane protein implicated in regulation of membrane protease activity
LEAYAEVAGEDARHAASIVARRLSALLVAGAAAFVSLLMFCAWLLALAWDGPWRSWVAGGLALAFAAVAAALAWPVLRRGSGEQEAFFPRIRSELGRDRELLERAFDGGSRAQLSSDDGHARQ